MMVMTAKVDKKKGILILVAIAALILSVILLVGEGNAESTPTAASVGSNDGRVQFLEGFGWDVTTSPAETTQVKIPEETTEVFDRYNQLQKSQGYDLSQFAGKQVMRYVYEVHNFPGATEPVYATVLVYKNNIIGGDVTDTAAKGRIQGFKMPETATEPTTAATTAPTEATQ